MGQRIGVFIECDDEQDAESTLSTLERNTMFLAEIVTID